jgi:hypothetical protein
MKKLNSVLYLFIIALIGACTVGVNKDLLTGLSYSYNGISVEDAYLSVDNVKLSSNEIEFGKTLNITLTGVDGLEPVNGRVKIGCKIEVTDADGNIILANEDLYAVYDEEGFDPEEASVLNLTLTLGDPMEPGSEYNWKSHFWDKNGEGIIDTEIDIKIISVGE